jgi:hypothetical protein
VFGPGAPDVAAVLAVWAAREARAAAQLLRRHALSPFAAAAGLPATVHCVCLALVFVTSLEASHALSLAAPFAAELWPHLEAATRRHCRRVAEELKVSARCPLRLRLLHLPACACGSACVLGGEGCAAAGRQLGSWQGRRCCR